jgi:hypothetical protein
MNCEFFGTPLIIARFHADAFDVIMKSFLGFHRNKTFLTVAVAPSSRRCYVTFKSLPQILTQCVGC